MLNIIRLLSNLQRRTTQYSVSDTVNLSGRKFVL